MGLPQGVFGDALSDEQLRHDIHAGAIVRSLMLHLAPDMVAMEQAGGFTNRAFDLAQSNNRLSGMDRSGFAWATSDLSGSGVMGDPAQATAERGAQIATYQAARLCGLLQEISVAELDGPRSISASGFHPIDPNA